MFPEGSGDLHPPAVCRREDRADLLLDRIHQRVILRTRTVSCHVRAHRLPTPRLHIMVWHLSHRKGLHARPDSKRAVVHRAGLRPPHLLAHMSSPSSSSYSGGRVGAWCVWAKDATPRTTAQPLPLRDILDEQQRLSHLDREKQNNQPARGGIEGCCLLRFFFNKQNATLAAKRGQQHTKKVAAGMPRYCPGLFREEKKRRGKRLMNPGWKKYSG